MFRLYSTDMEVSTSRSLPPSAPHASSSCSTLEECMPWPTSEEEGSMVIAGIRVGCWETSKTCLTTLSRRQTTSSRTSTPTPADWPYREGPMEVYWCVLQPTKDQISSNVSSLKSGRLQCMLSLTLGAHAQRGLL
ncbi:hypothetical protein GBAR_LOCUS15055 [Geodia barretti]|uniref:Uncharacterized protein n=1 Tax=Geodia barretti TaxID=519541 RepID=A0AA35WR88_GEOBA|nr:hypothetical protein GBAR_LOCUS15055 [Geodia barretti]